jgi:hypothetical protein
MPAVGSCYQAVAIEDVTVDTSLCVIVNSKVGTHAVSKSPINLVTNPNSIYNQFIHVYL